MARMNIRNIIASAVNIIVFFHLFIRGKIIPGFKVGRKDLVIDIGCGDKPFWRADVFLDKLSLGDEHRFSSTGVIKDFGLFFDSDVTKTPFKDKVFDFSYCSHLLEHVERPDLAIKEITRISKRGYIEVPDGLIEVIWPYQSHLWFIFFQKDTLIFLRKGKTLSGVLKNNGSRYSYLVRKMKDPFIRIYWEKKIRYKIIDNLTESDRFISRRDNDDAHLQAFYVQKLSLFLTTAARVLFYERKEFGDVMKDAQYAK